MGSSGLFFTCFCEAFLACHEQDQTNFYINFSGRASWFWLLLLVLYSQERQRPRISDSQLKTFPPTQNTGRDRCIMLGSLIVFLIYLFIAVVALSECSWFSDKVLYQLPASPCPKALSSVLHGHWKPSPWRNRDKLLPCDQPPSPVRCSHSMSLHACQSCF